MIPLGGDVIDMRSAFDACDLGDVKFDDDDLGGGEEE